MSVRQLWGKELIHNRPSNISSTPTEDDQGASIWPVAHGTPKPWNPPTHEKVEIYYNRVVQFYSK